MLPVSLGEVFRVSTELGSREGPCVTNNVKDYVTRCGIPPYSSRNP